MIIEDYDSDHDIRDPSKIEQVLSKRLGGHNMFWLKRGTKEYPAIAILVNGDLAHVSYFPESGHAGFVSVGSTDWSEPLKSSVFFVNPTEEIWVADYQLVPFGDAVKVAKEFANSESLPQCIHWQSLVGEKRTDHPT
jgi:hypothetical protein